MKKETIAIIGTGLMGCSFAHGLNRHFNIIGVDSSKIALEQALHHGFIHTCEDIETAVALATMIIVATPTNNASTIISSVLEMAGEKTTVLDICSTKQNLCTALLNHPKRAQYVAAHPMAGAEKSGSQAASKELLYGKTIFVCEQHLSSDLALKSALQLFKILNLIPHYTTSVEHDKLMAQVSHLPQVVAFGLAAALSQNSEQVIHAGSGFDSTTRLSGSSAAMWVPILFQNKENILELIEQINSSLIQIAHYIESEDEPALCGLILKANQVRSIFEQRNTTTLKIRK